MHDPIYLKDEHRMLRDQLRRFIEAEVTPNGDAWEAAGMVPRDVLKRMGELGFFGIRYPESFGGAELDTIATMVLSEEMGRSTFGGFAITVLVHTDMASPHLMNAGNDEQKARFLEKVVSGELITAVGVTEPDAGSDVAAIRTRATRTDGGWILNGAKMFITNGVHGDLYFVAAKSGDPDADSRSREVTMFIVEKGVEGFSVGRSLDKMGWRSSDTAELIFDNCFVPDVNVLGEVHRGFYAIMQNFQNERLVLGAQAMGEAQKAIELTLEYVKDRKAFDGVLWDKQAIRQRLSQRLSEVEAGRHLVYHAAWLDTQGIDCVKEVSMVKAYCGELVNKVMYDCQQFHGGFGYMRESTIERMTRDARVQSVGGGATEVMLEEVAKRI
ncbi:MAG: acyl-CoA dehydrogenase [Alphaproteobacteria bacterium]|jgi:acyl-CoA dehydrogenase|nr:acyl-CoA dehydrogenase [Alphaproteobacteria bacterium]